MRGNLSFRKIWVDQPIPSFRPHPDASISTGICTMDKEVFSFEPLMSFVPHAIATDENPRLAGFPANLLYMGKRDETGLPYAIYVPDLILGREPHTAFLNVACGPKT